MSTKPKKRRPKSSAAFPWKKLLIMIGVVVGAVVLAAAIVVGCIFGIASMHEPDIDTGVPSWGQSENDDTQDSQSGNSQNPDDPENPADSSGTQSGTEYVRDTEIVNFLVVGRDKSAWNTDVMMIVNFNMREGSLSVLQIPRDTYIHTEKVNGRVNTLVKTMRQEAYKNDPTLSSSELVHAGMSGAVEILEQSLCVQIDGYAIVNLEGFRNIIDAIGGVYMDVPYDMTYEDPDQDLHIYLKKGPQILNGEKAEMFVRYRSGLLQGDIGRVDAQKIFLTALFKQLKGSVSIAKVPELVTQLVKHVTTDVPLMDIIVYAKELLGVDINNISMVTLPGSDSRSSTTGAWYYIMRRADTLSIVNEYFNVYNNPVTEAQFDKAHAFTDESYKPFADIYFAEATDVAVENAGDIDSDGIDIPLS